MEVSQTGGTPSHHPFIDGLFPGRNHQLLGWNIALGPRLGGTPRLGILATLNLSQISEFALVICSLGMGYGHIEPWWTIPIRKTRTRMQGSRSDDGMGLDGFTEQLMIVFFLL